MSGHDDDVVVCEARPYGWVIEYTPEHAMGKRFAFTPNDGVKDIAYVMQRAADLHGIVITVYRPARRQ